MAYADYYIPTSKTGTRALAFHAETKTRWHCWNHLSPYRILRVYDLSVLLVLSPPNNSEMFIPTRT